MIQDLLNNFKNIGGWRTKRKLVVFSVDDYGNVRLDSKQAREKMDKAGLKVHSRFDALDALESRQDLEQLFEVLSSAKDMHGRNAVFTPFALPCNINFEQMADEGYQKYQYEKLPQTYEKLAAKAPQAYEGTWELWKEGIEMGLLAPQFHGREHLNLKVFEEKLAQKDQEVLTALKNRSYTSISHSGYPTIGYSAAFDFWEYEENQAFQSIIKEGLNAFEEVFGYRSTHFNPPGGRESSYIHKYLKENGIKYMDAPLFKKEHQGSGKYKRIWNYMGKKNPLGMSYFVRNVVFEPTNDSRIDWNRYTLKQIEAAFRWNKPALISSHRINFSGHINPQNREKGLQTLKRLIQNIVKKWPDVEFIASYELEDIIKKGA